MNLLGTSARRAISPDANDQISPGDVVRSVVAGLNDKEHELAERNRQIDELIHGHSSPSARSDMSHRSNGDQAEYHAQNEQVPDPAEENTREALPLSVSRPNLRTERAYMMSHLLSFEEVRSGDQLFVDHILFDATIAGLIVLNAAILGIEVDFELGLAGQVVQAIFAAIWTIEAVWKMCSYGIIEYLCSSNLFDFVICLLAVVDAWILSFINTDTDISRFTVVRMIRVARILRVVRLLKMSRSLWLLITALAKSLSALGWILFLTLLFIYTFAILFSILVGKDCHEDVQPSDPWPETCAELYGSLPKSMYTLFEVMTLEMQGVRATVIHNPLTALPFLVFMTITSFGLLNVVMGVIVDQVLDASRTNEEYMEKMRTARQRLEMELLHDIFSSADSDGSGLVSLKEFQDVCARSDVQALFEELELPVSRKRLATRLFEVLDADSKGEMDVSVFLERTFTLKHDGKQLQQDQTMLLIDVRHLSRRLDMFEKEQAHQATVLARLEEQQDSHTALLQEILANLQELKSWAEDTEVSTTM